MPSQVCVLWRPMQITAQHNGTGPHHPSIVGGFHDWINLISGALARQHGYRSARDDAPPQGDPGPRVSSSRCRRPRRERGRPLPRCPSERLCAADAAAGLRGLRTATAGFARQAVQVSDRARPVHRLTKIADAVGKTDAVRPRVAYRYELCVRFCRGFVRYGYTVENMARATSYYAVGMGTRRKKATSTIGPAVGPHWLGKTKTQHARTVDRTPYVNAMTVPYHTVLVRIIEK